MTEPSKYRKSNRVLAFKYMIGTTMHFVLPKPPFMHHSSLSNELVKWTQQGCFYRSYIRYKADFPELTPWHDPSYLYEQFHSSVQSRERACQLVHMWIIIVQLKVSCIGWSRVFGPFTPPSRLLLHV